MCDRILNILSMCAMSSVVHTSNISGCQKVLFFSFYVAVKNSINVGPLVFCYKELFKICLNAIRIMSNLSYLREDLCTFVFAT
jgi:hypothetical protein